MSDFKLADFGVAVVLATNAGSARFSKGGGPPNNFHQSEPTAKVMAPRQTYLHWDVSLLKCAR